MDALLFDTYSPFANGGTGKAYDWNIIKQMKLKKKVIVAGGLCPDNVAYAIKKVNPYCVDVSSGVEASGKKDEGKIKNFIYMARES